MMDEFNKLPADPAWLKKTGELVEHAAQELKCMVLLVAVQEDGKLVLQVAGTPEGGPLYELAQDPPAMLFNLAMICKMQDEMGMKGGKH